MFSSNMVNLCHFYDIIYFPQLQLTFLMHIERHDIIADKNGHSSFVWIDFLFSFQTYFIEDLIKEPSSRENMLKQVSLKLESPLFEFEESSSREDMPKQVSHKLNSLLTDGKQESLCLYNSSLNIDILVTFDGNPDFDCDFPWPFLEEMINDIPIKVIYIDKHFDKLS